MTHASPRAGSRLVILDHAVADREILQTAVLPEFEVLLLTGDRDGVAQISDHLRAIGPVDQLAIVAHGFPGGLQLGNGELSLGTLERDRAALATWLNPHGNLLLYGCNVAAGDAGAEFVEKLQRLTNGNVAATASTVGNAALGGTWTLDGTAASPFRPTNLAAYPAVLSSYTIEQLISPGGFGSAAGVGQSFTVPTTGLLTAVTVDVFGTLFPNGTLSLYLNGGSPSAPLYSQAVSWTNNDGFNDTFTLSTPFPVTAGQTYVFFLTSNVGGIALGGAFADLYAGGNFVQGNPNVSIPNQDLAFRLQIDPPASAPSAPPPPPEASLSLSPDAPADGTPTPIPLGYLLGESPQPFPVNLGNGGGQQLNFLPPEISAASGFPGGIVPVNFPSGLAPGQRATGSLIPASDLPPGQYRYIFSQVSNAPNNPVYNFPIDLTVSLPTPEFLAGKLPADATTLVGNGRTLGGPGSQIINGGDGDDPLFGNQGSDLLTGGGGNDSLFGGQGTDWLLGGPGDDLLSGDFGDDVLIGGPGADTFALQKGQGIDSIWDFEVGIDKIGLRGGLKFEDLTIKPVSFSSQIFVGDELLGQVIGVAPAALGAANFIAI